MKVHCTAKMATVMLLIVLATIVQPIVSQFFTKTSKSIPRMGREVDDNLIMDDFEDENRENSPEFVPEKNSSNIESALKTLFTNLVQIPKFIQESVLPNYGRKLHKRTDN